MDKEPRSSVSAPTLSLDHIGIQVRALEPAIEAFTRLFGYQQATEPVLNTRHAVNVVFMEKSGSIALKLICPVEPAADRSTKLHHLAFLTHDLDAAIATLCAQGARMLSPPAPGEAFDDHPIAFLFAGGINVELVSTRTHRGSLPPANTAVKS